MFQKFTGDQLESHNRFIQDAEKVNGVPVILAPFGLKKMVIDGKTYLVPMTEAEQKEFLIAQGIEVPENPHGLCLYNSLSGGCEFSGGCISCGYKSPGDQASCFCNG